MLIRERTAIRAPLLERLPALRLISQRSAYPHIDIDACTRLGIIVSLEPARRHALVRHGRADLGPRARRDAPDSPAGGVAARPASGRPGSGTRCAARRWASTATAGSARSSPSTAGRSACGSSCGRARTSRARARADGCDVAREQAGVLRDCDVVSLHLRLVDATRGIVGAADLARMKPTALLVNTSRAGLIEPGALVAALRAGRPGMAAVDVYEQEPLRRSERSRCSASTTSSARPTSAT